MLRTTRKPTRRREPTPKQEGEQILESAAKSGADYAHEQVGGDYFRDWVYDQMLEAEQMRKRDPSSVIPLETPADARKVARNMLQQIEWDTKRQMDQQEILEMAGATGVFGAGSDDWVRDTYGITRKDVADAFFEAFDDTLQSTGVREWLTDLVLQTKEDMGGKVSESRRGRRPPPPDYSSSSAHAYNIEVFYPDERFARKHESEIGFIIQQPLVSQGKMLDGYRMEYGPIDRHDFRRLEGAIYSKLGNAVRVRLVQVMYAGGRVDPQTWAESHRRGRTFMEPQRSAGPPAGWDQPAPAWAARVVIIPGDPHTRHPWSAKVYDRSGHVRSGVNDPRREYVERWVATYFPGVPVEHQRTAPSNPQTRRRIR